MSKVHIHHPYFIVTNFHFRYFTDVLNMLQPVYVFIVFVMKRDVINAILGRTKEVRQKQRTSQENARKKQQMRRTDTGAGQFLNPAFSVTDISGSRTPVGTPGTTRTSASNGKRTYPTIGDDITASNA